MPQSTGRFYTIARRLRRHTRPGIRAMQRWLVPITAAVLAPVEVTAEDLPAATIDPVPLEEVVVTARKTEERAHDVPASVQVLSPEYLELSDPTSVLELQYSVPGLVVNNLGLNGAGYALRGIGAQGGNSASVATHLDGVYLGNSVLATTRLFDLERIEVLKGPQGTLYGRNSTGGSINLVVRAPSDELGAEAEVARGSFETTRLQGYVNVPLQRSAFRFSWIVSEGDGFIRNSVDGRRFAEQDFRGARVLYRARPTDRLRIDIQAQHVEDDGAIGELWLPRPDYLVDPADIRLATVTLADPFLVVRSDNAAMELEYDLGFASLHSISGYAESKVRDVDDCAGLPVLQGCIRAVLPSMHEQWSQEFRLVSRRGGNTDWLVGTYWYEDDSYSRFYQLTPVIEPDPTNDRLTRKAESVVAAYGQATWRPATAWSMTFGVRLNEERHRLSTVGTGTDDSPTWVAAANDWSNSSWRVDLQYAVADEINVYGGVSTGYRSGGFTIQPGGVLDGYDPEQLIAYEAGIKARWPERQLMLNVAAFSYDFTDMQINTSTITGTGLIFETGNAARAVVRGIDAEGRIRVGDRAAVSGGVVWLPERKFVDYRNDRTGDTLSGNKLKLAPEWTASIAFDYGRPLRNAGTISARLEYNYRSDFYYTVENVSQFAQDGFGLVNAFLRFEPQRETWYLFVSGHNLGNADYFNQVFLQSSPGFPKTFEAGFGYRF